ncbi:hypothetical protein BKA69DRAFT_1059374 [Paraphysoderma sedebokerense]|nr:hypothetical protein BKA69DRAFT_1059374 [Paraphysoderma sedebokerense]
MLTVHFSVRGVHFSIPYECVAKYPKSTLATVVNSQQLDDSKRVSITLDDIDQIRIQLDCDPQTFGVLLYYLQWNILSIPPTLQMPQVQEVFRKFAIPFPNAQFTNSTLAPPPSTPPPHEKPPAYDGSALSHSTSFSKGKRDSSLSQLVENSTETMLTGLLESRVAPILRYHAELGHKQITLYIGPEDIQQDEVATPDQYVATTSTGIGNSPNVTNATEWIYLQKKTGANAMLFSEILAVDTLGLKVFVVKETDGRVLYRLPKGYHFNTLSPSQQDAVIEAVAVHSKPKPPSEPMPHMEFFVQDTVLQKFLSILKKSERVDAKAEVIELATRSVNDFGLYEPKISKVVKVMVKIA